MRRSRLRLLNKAEEAAWAAAKKAGVSKDNFVSYKYVLSGDNHKVCDLVNAFR